MNNEVLRPAMAWPARMAILLLALLLAGMAGWWLTAPRLAVVGLQSAALAGNSEAVADRVDFPALRASLKGQLRARLVAEARSEQGPLAAIGTGLALAFIDPMVDAAITPEALHAATSLAADHGIPTALAAMATLATPETTIERDGLDRFSVRATRAPDLPALLFCRDGLGYDLCGVDLSLAT